jgi:hypothetical protein
MDEKQSGPLLTVARVLSLPVIERLGGNIYDICDKDIRESLRRSIGELLTDPRPRVVILGEMHRTVIGERVELRRSALVVLLRPEDARVGEYVWDVRSACTPSFVLMEWLLEYQGVKMAFLMHRFADGDTEYRVWQRTV